MSPAHITSLFVNLVARFIDFYLLKFTNVESIEISTLSDI